ncbi:hypothetical protein BgiMline_033982, partial [Biomphalaria glabrata]
ETKIPLGFNFKAFRGHHHQQSIQLFLWESNFVQFYQALKHMNAEKRFLTMFPSYEFQEKPVRRLSEYMFQPIREENSPLNTESIDHSDVCSVSSAHGNISPSPTNWVRWRCSHVEKADPHHIVLNQMTVALSQSFTDDCSSELERIWEQSSTRRTKFMDRKHSKTPRSNIAAPEEVAHGGIKEKMKSNLYRYNIASDSTDAEKGAKIDHYWELCQGDAEHVTTLERIMSFSSVDLARTTHYSASTDVSESSALLDADDQLKDKRCTRKRKSVTFLENKDVPVPDTASNVEWANFSPDAKKPKHYSKRKKKSLDTLNRHVEKAKQLLEKTRKLIRRNGDEASRNASRARHKGEKHLHEKRRTIKTVPKLEKSYRSLSLDSLEAASWSGSKKRNKVIKATNLRLLADLKGKRFQHKLSNPELAIRDRHHTKHFKVKQTGYSLTPKTSEIATRQNGSNQDSPGKSNIKESPSLDERLLEALLYQKEDRLIRSLSAERATFQLIPSKRKTEKNHHRALSRKCSKGQTHPTLGDYHSAHSSSKERHRQAQSVSKKSIKLKPQKTIYYFKVKRKKHKENSSNERLSNSEICMRQTKSRSSKSKQKNCRSQKFTFRSESPRSLTKKTFPKKEQVFVPTDITRTTSEPSFLNETGQSSAKKKRHKRSSSLSTENIKRPAALIQSSPEAKQQDGLKIKKIKPERKRKKEKLITKSKAASHEQNHQGKGASTSRSPKKSKTNTSVMDVQQKTNQKHTHLDVPNFTRSKIRASKQKKENCKSWPSNQQHKNTHSTSEEILKSLKVKEPCKARRWKNDGDSKCHLGVKHSPTSSNLSADHLDVWNKSSIKGILKNCPVPNSDPVEDTMVANVTNAQELPSPFIGDTKSVEKIETKTVDASTTVDPALLPRTETKPHQGSAERPTLAPNSERQNFFRYIQSSAAKLVQEVKETFGLIDMVEDFVVDEMESDRNIRPGHQTF